MFIFAISVNICKRNHEITCSSNNDSYKCWYISNAIVMIKLCIHIILISETIIGSNTATPSFVKYYYVEASDVSTTNRYGVDNNEC
jgi:hypothetical protein